MEGTSQKVTLPVELDMENKGCSQKDISSMVKPYIEPPIYPSTCVLILWATAS